MKSKEVGEEEQKEGGLVPGGRPANRLPDTRVSWPESGAAQHGTETWCYCTTQEN